MTGVKNLTRSSDLLRKLGWTFLLLVFYRIGIHVPIPGINAAALQAFFQSAGNPFFGLLDIFSGGGLSNVSIFSLGVMPYISSSIIMQLLQVLSPSLKRLAREEGQAGRKKVTQYTRYGTVLIALVQGLAMANLVQGMPSPGNIPVVSNPGPLFIFVTTITVIAGTILIMWIGERITEKGVGNGISLIIFAGIVSSIPGSLYRFYSMLTGGSLSVFMALLLALLLAAVLVFIVFMERGQRRVPVHYAKRQVGRKMMGGQNTHLPLRVNTSGVIPPIFASSLLMFPSLVVPQFVENETIRGVLNLFLPGTPIYTVLFVGLIVFFCFFYTAIIFDPKDIAENLKKQGGFIPGIRPGLKTQEYIDRVLTRITLWGAIYVSAICVLPQLLLSRYSMYLGGTSLLIVVGVAMDFMGQVESHLISHQYEGLLGKARIKGRMG
jgi:preprotein translocase subunit SecY